MAMAPAAAYSAVAVPCALFGLAVGTAIQILQRRRGLDPSCKLGQSLDLESGSTVSPSLLESFVTEQTSSDEMVAHLPPEAPLDEPAANRFTDDMPDVGGHRPVPYELPSAQNAMPYEFPAPGARSDAIAVPEGAEEQHRSSTQYPTPYELPSAQKAMPYELPAPGARSDAIAAPEGAEEQHPSSAQHPMPYVAPVAPKTETLARSSRREMPEPESESVAESDLALGLVRKLRLAKAARQPLNKELAMSVAQSDLALGLAAKLRVRRQPLNPEIAMGLMSKLANKEQIEDAPRSAAAKVVCKERIETAAETNHSDYISTVCAALQPPLDVQ